MGSLFVQEADTATCRVCLVVKPVTEFYVDKSKRLGRRSDCKACCRARTREWYALNPRAWRRSRLRLDYGITPLQYQAMVVAQDGRCAICQDEPGPRLLSVDHDHETGAVRSLLCGRCNTGLGLFRDRPEVLRRAAEYLGGGA